MHQVSDSLQSYLLVSGTIDRPRLKNKWLWQRNRISIGARFHPALHGVTDVRLFVIGRTFARFSGEKSDAEIGGTSRNPDGGSSIAASRRDAILNCFDPA